MVSTWFQRWLSQSIFITGLLSRLWGYDWPWYMRSNETKGLAYILPVIKDKQSAMLRKICLPSFKWVHQHIEPSTYHSFLVVKTSGTPITFQHANDWLYTASKRPDVIRSKPSWKRGVLERLLWLNRVLQGFIRYQYQPGAHAGHNIWIESTYTRMKTRGGTIFSNFKHVQRSTCQSS